MEWIKNKIRKWLGLSEMFMGVDLGYRDESCIIICSRLKGGQVRIIDTRFGNYTEMEKKVKILQAQYSIADNNVTIDKPY